MWCSVSQCVAVCRSELQGVAVSCSVLQCVVISYGVLQCATVQCSVPQCIAVCHSVLQCATVCYSVLQCVAVRSSLPSCCIKQLHHADFSSPTFTVQTKISKSTWHSSSLLLSCFLKWLHQAESSIYILCEYIYLYLYLYLYKATIELISRVLSAQWMSENLQASIGHWQSCR